MYQLPGILISDVPRCDATDGASKQPIDSRIAKKDIKIRYHILSDHNLCTPRRRAASDFQVNLLSSSNDQLELATLKSVFTRLLLMLAIRD